MSWYLDDKFPVNGVVWDAGQKLCVVETLSRRDGKKIAAGPELLEACKAGLSNLESVLDSLGALSNPSELRGHGFNADDITEVFAALGNMKAAIAKAEGAL